MKTNKTCPACGGYGIMGGKGGYYDTPGKMKPCGTCDGKKTISLRSRIWRTLREEGPPELAPDPETGEMREVPGWG